MHMELDDGTSKVQVELPPCLTHQGVPDVGDTVDVIISLSSAWPSGGESDRECLGGGGGGGGDCHGPDSAHPLAALRQVAQAVQRGARPGRLEASPDVGDHRGVPGDPTDDLRRSL